MADSHDNLLQLDAQRPGVLRFGGARMALLDIEAGFWALRQHVETLVGRRLADTVLQQAGAAGGASFARAFVGSQQDGGARADGALALRDCIVAYQAAGFGRFEVETLDWPIGRAVIRAHDAFEAWAAIRHGIDGPSCAYTAGVLVGFVNIIAGRSDVVCVERACQADGSNACVFELLPAEIAGDTPSVALTPDPAMRGQLGLLEILFERMPMGIAIFDRDCRLRRCNLTWKEYAARYTPTALAQIVPGKTWFELVPGSENEVFPVIERVLNGETVRQEALRLDSGGIVSYWDTVWSPLVENGQVVGLVDVTIDATARVQALEELARTVDVLREREERLALVLRGTNDGIWDWNVETGQVYFSPRWKEMLGYTEDEIADTFDAWRTLIHPNDVERAVSTVDAYLAGASPQFRLEHRLRHKDGSYRWILARGAAVRDEAGRPTRMVGSHTDITERKLAEASLQRQVAFENIVTGISTKFINLTPEEVDQGIRDALQMLGEFAGVDRSYVFLFSGDRTTMSCTHEWCAEGITPQIQRMQDVPVDALAWSNRRLLNLETLYIPNLDDLPPEAAAERAEFARQGNQSLVAVPLAYRGAPAGFLGFDAVRTPKMWSERDQALLKIVGEIVVNALEHRRAQAIQDGQRQFLELLATGGGFSETLHTLVRIIEEQWPGMQGLILLLDEDGVHLHIGAAVTLPEEYTASIEGLEIGPLVGSCGTACYLRERVIVENIHTDPRWDGLRDLAVKYGLGACWSEPVLDAGGQVLGTFAMYYRQPRAPTEAELHTIETAAHLVGIAIEHQRARQEVEQAYRSLEQRVEERTREIERRRQAAESLRDILRLLNSAQPLDAILDVMVAQACQLTKADGGVIYRYDDIHANSTIVAMYGMPPAFAGLGSFPLTGTQAQRAVSERRPHSVPDFESYFAAISPPDDPMLYRWYILVLEHFKAKLTAPIFIREQPYGALELYYHAPRTFSDETMQLALMIGDQAALAIENARLREQAEQAAVSAERNRIARELHDSVSQALYGIALGTRTVRTLVDRQPVEDNIKVTLANPLEYVLSLADAGLAEMRALIFELRPDALEKEGLVVALTKQAEAVRARHKLDVQTDFCAEPPEMPLAVKEALYRVSQEALNNLIKHAHANRVDVRLHCKPDVLILEVRDDGVGFDPQGDYRGHLGLHTMRERVERLGGVLEIQSASGQGTTVRVALQKAID